MPHVLYVHAVSTRHELCCDSPHTTIPFFFLFSLRLSPRGVFCGVLTPEMCVMQQVSSFMMR